MQTEENKKIMANNIKRYMEQKGVTNQQLCEDLGFKYTTFLDWVKAVTYPRIGKIEAMADYFGILKSDLIEEKVEDAINDRPEEMAELHFEMIMDEDLNDIFKYFKDLDDKERQLVKDLVRSMAERKKEEA